MSYKAFHTVHEDFEGRDDIEPAFYDTDGSPVYEEPYGHLIRSIVAQNDVAALRLYHQNPKTNIWYEFYELPSWHPVFVAFNNGSCDVLRAMMEIYLTDPRYTEPLTKYLERLQFSPIQMACHYADRDFTLWLVHPDRSLATLHSRNKGGETPLLSAAFGLGHAAGIPRDRNSDILVNDHEKHEDFVYFLIDQGCSVQDSSSYTTVNGEEELRSTVLGAALPRASYKMVSRLIAEGAPVHARQKWRADYSNQTLNCIVDSEHATALHIASYHWNVEAIRALFDNNGDLSIAEMASAADNHGRIPLHFALRGVLNEYDEEPFSQEKLSDRIETVKLLLKANPESINTRDAHSATVFNFAARSDTSLESTMHIMKMLLDAKPDPCILKTPGLIDGKERYTVLQDAVIHHDFQHGAFLDEGFIQFVDFLLDNGADTHLFLHELCKFSWSESIDHATLGRLLELIDVNETDSRGCTPLHYLVCKMDQIDAMRALVNSGADVNMANHEGNTPLHEVALRGSLILRMDEKGEKRLPGQTKEYMERIRKDCMQVLIDAGGLMDLPNSAGKTPSQLLDERANRGK